MMDKVVEYIFKVGLLVSGYFFGGWTDLLGWLFLLNVVDYVTGMAASAYEAKTGKGEGLRSTTGARGIPKKVFIWAIIAVAFGADKVLGSFTVPLINLHLPEGGFRDAATAYYCSNEILSLIENSGRLNWPLPAFLRDIVAVLRGKAKSKGD